MDDSFGAALQAWAAADRDRPALTCQGHALSRGELLTRAQSLAERLVALGVVAGTNVTIGLPNSVEFIEAALATWWLGAMP